MTCYHDLCKPAISVILISYTGRTFCNLKEKTFFSFYSLQVLCLYLCLILSIVLSLWEKKIVNSSFVKQMDQKGKDHEYLSLLALQKDNEKKWRMN